MSWARDSRARAFAFFKSLEREGDTIGGEAFSAGDDRRSRCWPARRPSSSASSWTRWRRATIPSFIGEVVEAGVRGEIEGRADDATLIMKDLGEKVFYGG